MKSRATRGESFKWEFVTVQIGGVLRFTSWRLLYNGYKRIFLQAVVGDDWTVNVGAKIARHCVRNEIISQQNGSRSSPTLVIGSFFLYKCLFGCLGTYKSEAYLLVDFQLLLVLTKGAR